MRTLENFLQDLRFAFRISRRSPVFTALAVLSLTIGIGGTVAIFSVVKAVALSQLPYKNPDRIVALSEVDASGQHKDGVGGWMADQWRTRASSFESISLYGDGQRVLIEDGRAEVLRGMRVSHDFFETLGVHLLLGGAFQPADDVWPRNNVVILTYGLWMSRFGGDPHIVGRALKLTTEMYRVIGVLPGDFYPLRMSNPAERPAIFMPLGYDAAQGSKCQGCFGGRAIGRLKSGAGIEKARAELNGIMKEIARDDSANYGPDTSVLVEPLRDRVAGSVRTELWLLMAAVALVLLIVCANVASLLLARATGRAREISIRTALGCSAWRLASQLVTECLLLSIVGGATGTALAWQGIPILKALAPKELPRLDEIRIDASVLLFAIGLSVLTGLLFVIAPARATKQYQANHSPRYGARGALVAGEVALAFVLALATGLLTKSFLRLSNVDAGFDPKHVFTLTLTLTGERYDTHEATLEYYRQVREHIRAVPGILGVAMVDNVPLSHTDPEKIHIEGVPDVSDSAAPSADVFRPSPDYFRVLKIPLKRGRFFTDRDGAGAPVVALLSESVAKSWFPASDPVGRRIQVGSHPNRSPWITIVGIVGDVHNAGFDRAPDQAIYLPHAINNAQYTRLLVRTAGEPMRFEQSIRAAIRGVDPLQAVFHVQSMDEYVASSFAYRSFTLTLIGLFGTLAVLLAGMGIYGVISHLVGLRTRELGIRMALGAERLAILKLVLRDVFLLLAFGLAAGFAAGLALAGILSHLLFEVRPTDLATWASVAAILASVGLAAGYFPARRAMAVDPAHALRSE